MLLLLLHPSPFSSLPTPHCLGSPPTHLDGRCRALLVESPVWRARRAAIGLSAGAVQSVVDVVDVRGPDVLDGLVAGRVGGQFSRGAAVVVADLLPAGSVSVHGDVRVPVLRGRRAAGGSARSSGRASGSPCWHRRWPCCRCCLPTPIFALAGHTEPVRGAGGDLLPDPLPRHAGHAGFERVFVLSTAAKARPGSSCWSTWDRCC